MTDQNDSGGGCLLWFINWLIDRNNAKKIRERNVQARGLQLYNSVTTNVLFPLSSYQENIVISGGDAEKRLKFSQQIISNCSAQGQAMIVLHLGNRNLESAITTSGFGTVVSNMNKIFDAFTDFNLQEICHVVLDINKTKYDIKPAGRYILQIIHDLLACKSMLPYFSNFASAPFHRLAEKINDLLTAGSINMDKANELNSFLMMGQTEIPKIDSFFYDMKAQINHIATPNANTITPISVLSAINNGKILCIDLNTSANTMLIELVVNSLNIAMNRGLTFTLFIDDVAIVTNESLKNLLCQKSNHNNVICSKDLYTLLNSKDDVFNTIIGAVDKTVLLSHSSHVSCEKWSRYIGEYEKIDVSHNTNSGWHQSSRWGFNTNQGKTMNKKREYKIKPEEINQLSNNEIFVYDNQTSELIYTVIV